MSKSQDNKTEGSTSNDALVQAMVKSYQDHPQTQHIDATFLPSRSRTIELVELLRQLMFPGFFDDHRISSTTLHSHIGEVVARIRNLLTDQIRQSLRHAAYKAELSQNTKLPENQTTLLGHLPPAVPGDQTNRAIWDEKALELTETFLHRLTCVREILATDIQAAVDGDPAAEDTDEVIFCYPGVDAIFIHRVAHELYLLDIPLLPRIMSEYAHNETGIDLHPGATIGKSFFLDHGTGVVIGETCIIGERVKVYQGVTLGALSTKGGQKWRGQKRHPTIEDDVTIYGGAIILGGETVIGAGATIGGSVFLTRSVPKEHTVTMQGGELNIKPPKNGNKATG